MDSSELAKYYSGGRVGIGLLLLVFPGRVLQGMLGGRHEVSPEVKLIGRMLGARDAILGAGALQAAASSEAGKSELRAWMAYSAAADAADALAMIVAYRHLPKRKRVVMAAMALGGAGTGVFLMNASDT